jgi:hypothetical protein
MHIPNSVGDNAASLMPASDLHWARRGTVRSPLPKITTSTEEYVVTFTTFKARADFSGGTGSGYIRVRSLGGEGVLLKTSQN